MQTSDKPCLAFDVTWKMRVPGDLVPRIHAHARRRGLNSSAWIRSLIFDALAEAEHHGEQKTAA